MQAHSLLCEHTYLVLENFLGQGAFVVSEYVCDRFEEQYLWDESDKMDELDELDDSDEPKGNQPKITSQEGCGICKECVETVTVNLRALNVPIWVCRADTVKKTLQRLELTIRGWNHESQLRDLFLLPVVWKQSTVRVEGDRRWFGYAWSDPLPLTECYLDKREEGDFLAFQEE